MNKADWAKYKKSSEPVFKRNTILDESENALLINWFKGIQDLNSAIYFYVLGIWNLIRSCMYIICDLLASRWVKGWAPRFSSIFFSFDFSSAINCDFSYVC